MKVCEWAEGRKGIISPLSARAVAVRVSPIVVGKIVIQPNSAFSHVSNFVSLWAAALCFGPLLELPIFSIKRTSCSLGGSKLKELVRSKNTYLSNFAAPTEHKAYTVFPLTYVFRAQGPLCYSFLCSFVIIRWADSIQLVSLCKWYWFCRACMHYSSQLSNCMPNSRTWAGYLNCILTSSRIMEF